MGTGRQGTRRLVARENGDLEEYEKLKPPSEKTLRDDQRCGALTKAQTPCKQVKGGGTDHPGYGYCVRHGGNTPAGIKSAMREMGRDLILKYKTNHTRFGGDRKDPSIATLSPEQALLEEVRRSAAMVRFLEERIAQWNLTTVHQQTVEKFVELPINKKQNLSLEGRVDDLLRSLDPENPDSPAYLPALTQTHSKTGLSSFTDAREWLILYRDERGHLARTAKMAIDAGVATRLVTIAEDQGRILASAIRAVLGALQLTPDQAQLVPRVVPPILRAVAADQPIPDISSLIHHHTAPILPS